MSSHAIITTTPGVFAFFSTGIVTHIIIWCGNCSAFGCMYVFTKYILFFVLLLLQSVPNAHKFVAHDGRFATPKVHQFGISSV